jgi:hypothetical protein
VGDSENALPNHQRPSHDVVAINAPVARKPAPIPAINRTLGASPLDIDQLAAVLARILES